MPSPFGTGLAFAKPEPGDYPHHAAIIMPLDANRDAIAWCEGQYGPMGDHSRWSRWFGTHGGSLRMEVWFRDAEDHTLFTLRYADQLIAYA